MTKTVRRACWLLIAAIALCVPLVASAQDRGETCSLLSAGNDIYTIYTWEEPGNSAARDSDCPVGSYGVVTGPLHPSGEGLPILQDGANPLTSFNTVMSVSSNTAYVLADGSGVTTGAETPVPLAAYGDADETDATTLTITFDTLGVQTLEELEMVVEIEVVGTTIDDSKVRVETTVKNLAEPEMAARGGSSVSVAIRHLWDFAIDAAAFVDAGPSLWAYPSNTNYTAEASFISPSLPSVYEISANQGPSYYWAIGSGSSLEPNPPADRGAQVEVPPTRIHYVCAPRAAAAAFFYGTLPTIEVASLDTDCDPAETGDSGVAYYWMQEQSTETRTPVGIFLDPGESYTVDSWLWSNGGPPPQTPDLCLTLELDATQVNGNLGVPGLQNNDVVCGEDVLEFVLPPLPIAARGDEDPFEMFFDGSDVGITRTIIDGLDIQEPFYLPPDFVRGPGAEEPMDLLLSFNIAHSIPPIGLVLQADIVRFVADENGANTDGAFERFFDGSDIGLQSAGEDIDAFVFEPNLITAERGMKVTLGDLFFSTKGNLNIPGLTASDEDIVVCWGYSFTVEPGGDITSTCEQTELFFDGSEAGLANASEDVDAFAFGAFRPRGPGNGPLYLSTRGNFSVNDVNGRNEDVFVCFPQAPAPAERALVLPITDCEGVEIVFDGSDYGLGNNNVFSIDLLAPEQIICAERGPCLQR